VTNDIKRAVLQTAIIPTETLPELERWGLDLPENGKPETTLRYALENLREAIESKDSIEFRMTYLDALDIYEKNRQTGRLYYLTPDNSTPGVKKSKTTFVEVSYALLPSGAYLIPWTDEDISYLMIEKGTYLKPVGGSRVYFRDVDSNFYGEQRAFLICQPATAEDRDEGVGDD